MSFDLESTSFAFCINIQFHMPFDNSPFPTDFKYVHMLNRLL